jgi:SNF2 family DNA or RNA helicase
MKSTIGQIGVLLLSLHAACVGLNITCANHVLFVDAWWNPTAEEQGVGRAHRLGQQKIVKVYRFINPATIEARIYERQVSLLWRRVVISDYILLQYGSVIRLVVDQKIISDSFAVCQTSGCQETDG